MNVILLVTSTMAFGGGIAHSTIGELFILRGLLARAEFRPLLGSTDLARRTLRLGWHAASVAWAGLGALLLSLSLLSNETAKGEGGTRPVLWAVAATFLATALLIGLMSRGRHLAWTLFLLMAALTLAEAW